MLTFQFHNMLTEQVSTKTHFTVPLIYLQQMETTGFKQTPMVPTLTRTKTVRLLPFEGRFDSSYVPQV